MSYKIQEFKQSMWSEKWSEFGKRQGNYFWKSGKKLIKSRQSQGIAGNPGLCFLCRVYFLVTGDTSLYKTWNVYNDTMDRTIMLHINV